MIPVPPPPAPRGTERVESGTARDVVIVDDDELSLYIFRRRLERIGHRVRIFPDAAAALSELAGEDARVPDVLFVDLRMPGLCGLELLARWSAAVPDLRGARLFVCSATLPTRAELARIHELGALPVVKDALRDAEGFARLLADA